MESRLRPAERAHHHVLESVNRTVLRYGSSSNHKTTSTLWDRRVFTTEFNEVIDLRIDDKNRRDNGKGVRAVTHFASKVAHHSAGGLDTPLLTYRDPIRTKSSLGAETICFRFPKPRR